MNYNSRPGKPLFLIMHNIIQWTLQDEMAFESLSISSMFLYHFVQFKDTVKGNHLIAENNLTLPLYEILLKIKEILVNSETQVKQRITYSKKKHHTYQSQGILYNIITNSCSFWL